MKNYSKAWSDTREYREIGTGFTIAGLAGIAWGQIDSPDQKLTLLIGFTLCVAALAFDAFMFFSALLEVGWFTRLQERKAFEAWKAKSAQRVAEGIAAFARERSSARERCQEPGNWCPTLHSEMSRMYDAGYAIGYAIGYENGQRDMAAGGNGIVVYVHDWPSVDDGDTLDAFARRLVHLRPSRVVVDTGGAGKGLAELLRSQWSLPVEPMPKRAS